MKHLTTDEILDFVSVADSSDESVRKCAAVTGHIRECADCLRLVQAYQQLYDAFEELGIDGSFWQYAQENLLPGEQNRAKETGAALCAEDPER